MMRRSWLTAAFAAGLCAASNPFLPAGVAGNGTGSRPVSSDLQVLEHTLEALEVLQTEYFEPWLGEWPATIDWTAAVMGSHVSGALITLTKALRDSELGGDEAHHKARENIINMYFSQLVSSYFGQNALSIRNQAFDDILWVVLGWLDTIQFIDLHTTLHRQDAQEGAASVEGLPALLRNQSWHGNIWIPAFAHRSRLFWELASRGWDYFLCGGGMTWNPRLEPYKNSITNELFISASTSMYLYFPGDDNTSPYRSGASDPVDAAADDRPYDQRYLFAALEGYKWLMNSGMTNAQGLFTDGFHISGLHNKSDPKTECDARNEMVYTYNQGVILTGQAGLFRVTGDAKYLRDGHRLIHNVIAATGYDLRSDQPADNLTALKPGTLPEWYGLGRAGVMEDACDVGGHCTQNSHTFKGIFFHHLTAFCAPLKPAAPMAPMGGEGVSEQLKKEHGSACRAYLGWLRHNADAALLTRDAAGRFGMWWTAGLLNLSTSDVRGADRAAGPPNPAAVDYRNDARPLGGRAGHQRADGTPPPAHGHTTRGSSDPNDRGRGRTVETQGSGLALLRALWEVSQLDSGR